MSTWKQFWLLLKVQLPPAFRGRKDAAAKRSQVGYTVLMTVALAVVIGTVTVAYIGMAEALRPFGLLYIIPSIAMAGGSIFCLLTTIYKTNGLLFAFQDYELVMALPFRSSVVTAARLMILYVYNLSFLLAVMAPAMVVYGIYAGAGFWFYLVYIIEMLLTPLVPNALATLIGTLIATAASRFQRRGIAGIILTLVFMVGWVFFVYNIDFVIEGFGDIGPVLNSAITSVYPLAGWFAQGCCDLNMGAFALFAGVSVGVYVVYCWIIGKLFRRINSRLTTFGSAAHYKLTALKSAGVQRALLHKEFKKLTGSSNYFLNACIGPIMAIVLAALMCFGLGGTLSELTEMPDMSTEVELPFDAAGAMLSAVALFISFMVGMTETTAMSISLEGRQLWIIKTAPVSTQEILRSKLLLNLIIAAIGAVGAGIFLLAGLPFDPLYSPFLILTPLIFGIFSTVWGQKLNLRFAQFDWTDEMRVVKRSKPVMYITLINMAIAFVSMFGTILLGGWVMLAVDAALLVWSAFTYRWLMTKGAALFDAYAA